MKKIFFSLILILFGCLNVNANSKIVNCEIVLFMQDLLKSDSNWVPVERLDKRDGASNIMQKSEKVIFPITEISVQDSVIWVKTYHADFFPAKLKVIRNKLLLDELRFLRPIPGGPSKQAALKMEKYTSDDVKFTLKPFNEDCTIGNYIVLNIENIHTPLGPTTESILLSRSNQQR